MRTMTRLMAGLALSGLLNGVAAPRALAQMNEPDRWTPQPRGSSARPPAGALQKPSSTVIDFWYGKLITFRTQGVPQRWANILGTVSDPDGIASLTYSLNGGPEIDLSIGPDTRRLLKPGDFNIDLAWAQLDPLPDTNAVIVTAIDSLANILRDTVRVLYRPSTVWDLPYTVAWTSPSSLADSAQVVDGTWARDGDGLRPVDIGYDRLVAIGDTTWDDYEISVPITMHSVDPGGYNPQSAVPVVGLLLRWVGHTDMPASVAGWQPRTGWEPSGALGMYAFNQTANGGERLEIWKKKVDSSGKKLQMNQPYVFKMRAQNQPGGIFYGLRVWSFGQPEPETWDLTWLDTANEAPRGSILLLSHHVDATFGAVTVVPDTAPLPVQLAGFSGAVVAGLGVELTWRTVSEVNNYGFEVERAERVPEEFLTIAGSFVAGHGTTVDPKEYAFVDPAPAPGLWYYRLRQIDLDGTVTVHEPIAVRVELVASADSPDIPRSFGLDQNYPNPFNPTTTITFHLPEARPVRIALYDLLGQEIARLADGMHGAGTHRLRLDASGLAAGSYVCRMQAGEFSATRRMLLIK